MEGLWVRLALFITAAAVIAMAVVIFSERRIELQTELDLRAAREAAEELASAAASALRAGVGGSAEARITLPRSLKYVEESSFTRDVYSCSVNFTAGSWIDLNSIPDLSSPFRAAFDARGVAIFVRLRSFDRQVIFEEGDSSRGFSMWYEAGTLYAMYFDGAAEAVLSYSVSSGPWHVVATSYDAGAGTFELIVDGRIVNSTSAIGQIGDRNGEAAIGKVEGSSRIYGVGAVSEVSSPLYLQGRVAAFAVWNRSITTADVWAFERGRPPVDGLLVFMPMDECGGTVAHDVALTGNDGTLMGTAEWVDDAPSVEFSALAIGISTAPVYEPSSSIGPFDVTIGRGDGGAAAFIVPRIPLNLTVVGTAVDGENSVTVRVVDEYTIEFSFSPG